jgi:hypothetical protein
VNASFPNAPIRLSATIKTAFSKLVHFREYCWARKRDRHRGVLVVDEGRYAFGWRHDRRSLQCTSASSRHCRSLVFTKPCAPVLHPSRPIVDRPRRYGFIRLSTNNSPEYFWPRLTSTDWVVIHARRASTHHCIYKCRPSQRPPSLHYRPLQCRKPNLLGPGGSTPPTPS